MSHRALISALLLAYVSPASAQTPSAESRPAVDWDVVRRALADADGGRKPVVADAAATIANGGPEARARFMATYRRIVAAAPQGDSRPATRPAAEKPAEFSEAVRALMARVVVGDAADASAALATLTATVEDGANVGARAAARLAERAEMVLQRLAASRLQQEINTGAVYAGQFADLAVHAPEIRATLLRWVAEPPRDVRQPEPFRTACVRALRDVTPAGASDPADVKTLKAVLAKATPGQYELSLTVACALRQFGDSEAFDRIRSTLDEAVASDDPRKREQGHDMLAQLLYHARDFSAAADAYKTLLSLAEKRGATGADLATPYYNSACSLALAGRIDEAFTHLEKAMEYGAKARSLDKRTVDSDHDIDALRKDPRFAALYAKHYK
ncbi:MAG TPA: tetratricopeptide repeat protein [Planctomycetota bacterium]|nr:tetratricopeptide repeat protein [Planctomycetota bacterium]